MFNAALYRLPVLLTPPPLPLLGTYGPSISLTYLLWWLCNVCLFSLAYMPRKTRDPYYIHRPTLRSGMSICHIERAHYVGNY